MSSKYQFFKIFNLDCGNTSKSAKFAKLEKKRNASSFYKDMEPKYF